MSRWLLMSDHARSPAPFRLEVVLSTFNTTWDELRNAAQFLDHAGISGLWIMDHFFGSVHNRSHVLECWSVLAGLAGATTQCRLGSLVTNASVRRPTVLAQTAATVQQQATGRLAVGIGAGGGAPDTKYAAELDWVGVANGTAAERRAQLKLAIETIRETWRDANETGALRPSPTPPIIVGGYGTKVATIAGTVADGFNTSANNPDLRLVIDAARSANAARLEGPASFEISAFANDVEKWTNPSGDALQELRDTGVDTVQLVVAAPFDAGLLESIATCAANV